MPVENPGPEFNPDFAPTELAKIQRERRKNEQMCVECFLYKNVDLFRPNSNVCTDCEDE